MSSNNQHQQSPVGTTSATYMPGSLDNDFYMPSAQPVLVAPEPQRINPEMSNQIADGLRHLDLNSNRPPSYARLSTSTIEAPHLSPFPKVTNKPNWLPPSDEEVETTLDSAREQVLNSTDPEIQLAWAQDALTYVSVCAEDEERRRAIKPGTGRSQTPRVEHQLKTDAMSVVNFLADQHHPKAEFLKGMWLEFGRFGQREDKKEAFRCYNRAADRHYFRAHYRIGMLYESYNDPIKALRHYHMGVDAGDAASCYRLGMMSLRGQHGQPQDFPRAVDLLRKSADAADENAAQGAYVYGMLLARQLPEIELPDSALKYNESSARYYIQKAAYLKFAKAQTKMASMFELGSLGCEFNPSYSVHYNALASKQGEAEAEMALSKWFLVGYESLFPKNEELAYTYAERAAQEGLATAEFALGYFHEIGMYVAVDLNKAMEWYQKAWRHGNEDARGRIDGLERKQVLNKSDHEKMAVNRIKSQRGSMMGAKPEWLKQRMASQQQQQQQRPPPVPEIHNNPPSGSQNYSPSVYSPVLVSPHGAGLPPRDVTTPYPLSDAPPIAPPVRPATVTPYPLDDRPGASLNDLRPGPTGGFFNAHAQPTRPSTTINSTVRPSSAFQLDPNSHPGPTIQQHWDAGRLQGPPNNYNHPERPATVQPLNYGRSGSRPPGETRVASGPATLSPNSYPQQQRPVDLGYSAPLDDRRRPQAQQQQQQQQSHLSPNLPPQQYSQPQSHHQQQYHNPQPQFQPQQQQQQPKPYQSSRPTQSSMNPPFDPHRPAKQSLAAPSSSSSSSSRPNNAHASSHATSGGIHDGRKPIPPSKTQQPQSSGASVTVGNKPSGPKTFEEMGVPAGKQESECIIM